MMANDIASLARFPEENPNPVLRVSKDGALVYANGAASPLLEFWGISTGLPLPQRLIGHFKKIFREGVRQTVDEKLPDRDYVFDCLPIIDAGYLNVYARDVTLTRELQEARIAAEKADRTKSEFLANMSHEIRTPMNGVMGMAELLAATELTSKQKMFIDVILKSGASLLTIINDILDFSKIDAGQMELCPAPFKLGEAIEDVAAIVCSKVAEKDLELIVRVDPALPVMVFGDVGRIRQIVTNLMGNAVKFTEKGHVFVNVTGSVVDGETLALKVEVKDTGMGIPKEDCSRIFQKFSQVDTSATRKHEGTGLGLSISSSLVKLMGGEIGVESEAGKGSKFWFTLQLPLHVQEDDKDEADTSVECAGARILVIDDNALIRSILSEQMTYWGLDCAAARDGREGLAVMRTLVERGIRLDLVILDNQMPHMGGDHVLECIRCDDMLKHTPVVMLTSLGRTAEYKNLEHLDVAATLTKPTRSAVLRETVLKAISSAQSRDMQNDQSSERENASLRAGRRQVSG